MWIGEEEGRGMRDVGDKLVRNVVRIPLISRNEANEPLAFNVAWRGRDWHIKNTCGACHVWQMSHATFNCKLQQRTGNREQGNETRGAHKCG